MARKLSEYLQQLADAAKADEKADDDAAAVERLRELEAKAQAAPSLSEDDRDLLDWARKLRADLEAEQAKDEPKPKDDPKPKGEAKPKDDDKPGEPPAAKTRPGRKAGHAYDFDVDDDGNVVRLDVARIYSGADEPDEVELPADAA